MRDKCADPSPVRAMWAVSHLHVDSMPVGQHQLHVDQKRIVGLQRRGSEKVMSLVGGRETRAPLFPPHLAHHIAAVVSDNVVRGAALGEDLQVGEHISPRFFLKFIHDALGEERERGRRAREPREQRAECDVASDLGPRCLSVPARPGPP